MRDSMIFYGSFYEAISCLPDAEQLALYRAIMEYGLKGKQPELSGAALGMFLLMKPQIEANNRRFENGKKGGRQRLESTAEATEAGIDRRSIEVKNLEETKTEPNDNQEETKAEPKRNQTITKMEPRANQEETKAEPNVNVNVNDNDNVNENVNIKNKKVFCPPDADEVEAYCKEQGISVNPNAFVDFYASKGWMVGKNKMKDWRAAVRNWGRSEKQAAQQQTKTQNRFNNFHQRQYDFADLERQLLNAE